MDTEGENDNRLVELIGKRIDDRADRLETKFEEKFEALSVSLEMVMNQNVHFKKDITDLKQKNANLENEIERLAMYMARENIVITGVKEKENENVDEMVRRICVDQMHLSPAFAQNIEFQRIHRVGVRSEMKPRPIKARFLRYGDKVAIQKNAKNLKGTGIFISDDLPWRIRRERQLQVPILQQARREGKKAFFSRTEPAKLYINNVLIPRPASRLSTSERSRETSTTPHQAGGIQVTPGPAACATPEPMVMEVEVEPSPEGATSATPTPEAAPDVEPEAAPDVAPVAVPDDIGNQALGPSPATGATRKHLPKAPLKSSKEKLRPVRQPKK